MNSHKKVIGIIMTYNCADLVEDTYRRLPKSIFDEVFIIDDGSRDNIREVAKKLNIPFFEHRHLGYGGNLRYGLKKSMEMGADYMVEIHGDGQFDASVTSGAIQKMEEENLGFLIGSRFTNLKQPLKDGMPLPRYLANVGLSFIEKIILRIPWTEFHAGYRVYSREFLEKIDLTKGANDYLYSFQIIALAAYLKIKCGEVPIRADYRKAHTSVGYFRAAINSFQELWVLCLYIMAKLGIKMSIFQDIS